MARDDLVLIAGAGPVGLTAAVELTRRGIPVRIVDRGDGPTPSDQSRALAILPQTLRIFESSGLANDLESAGTPIRGAAIAIGGRSAFSFDFGSRRSDDRFILSLPQGRTERLLIDWLAARKIQVAWNTSLEALGETHRPVARLSGGETVEAKAILGCDGSHSTVRAELGVPWHGEGYPGVFALADVTFDRPIDPHRLVMAIGSSADASHALVPMDARSGRLIGFHDSPERLIAAVPGIESVTWQSTFHVAFRHAERMSRGRVFLAGDAAHIHSPVGGRGMNLGIWDAATFAYLFAEGRETEYEMKRLPAIRTVIEQTRAMTELLAKPPSLAGVALRTVMPLAVRLPVVRRKLADRLLALDLPQLEWL
ncbi:FAD-dependent monooxygenase [Jiella sp. MQZ9-1]|uniref:FAD-dependent monooxygenase n=1 Tax=Jiella flava TaxID=2816857 RepID=A0A939G0Y8_9HYPH|nr:FAD-dependent monooxygenase [Jiella flava]MBO0663835.1 FAD-dependent monooxygenase [Jiella flava]MCD2472408.1 FAD-dependent monooxygenase [Jiella flava]